MSLEVGFVMGLYNPLEGMDHSKHVDFIVSELYSHPSVMVYYHEESHQNRFREKHMPKPGDFFSPRLYEKWLDETKGLVINYPGRCGWTLLGACALYGYVELAEWLIKNGGNVSHCNDRGESIRPSRRNQPTFPTKLELHS